MRYSLRENATQWLRRRGLGLALAVLTLTPAVVSVWESSGAMAGRRLSRREHVLRRLSSDPTVLINVTARDMPSSAEFLNLGKRSTKALERCLADNVDRAMRSTCANMLGYVGDRRALPTLQAALEDWESTVRAVVVETLRQIPDASSVDPLIRLFKRKDESPYLRRRVLEALGAMSSQKALRLLRQELRNEPTEKERKRGEDLRVNAFRGLWASRHLMARTTLAGDVAYALGSDDDNLAVHGAYAAVELRDPSLVAPLTQLVDHRNDEIRNKSVHALGLIGNPRATRVLTREMPRVREARMLNNIAFALQRLDEKQYRKAIAQLMDHKQAIIRLNAAFVLGDVRQPAGLPLLEKALNDPSDYVKASAIVAIGKLGSKEGFAPLRRFLDHPNPSLREEAVYALYGLSGRKNRDLVYDRLFASAYAQSDDGRQMRHRAALELGKAGDTRVREYLLGCHETGGCSAQSLRDYFAQDPAPTVTRRLYRRWARGQNALTQEMARRRPPGLLELALGEKDSAAAAKHIERLKRSIDLVGIIGSPRERKSIEAHLKSKDTKLRLHAAVALVRLGDRTAALRLFEDLKNLPVEWLSTFVHLASRVDTASARRALTGDLEACVAGNDTETSLACAAVLLDWAPEQRFFRFLDALAGKTAHERDLAQHYLERNRSKQLTWVMRRALARETRPFVRDRLQQLLEDRG